MGGLIPCGGNNVMWNIPVSTNHYWALSFSLALLLGYYTAQVDSGNIRHRPNNEEGKPWFQPTVQNITVHPGNRALLKCRVENLGTKTVTWRKQGEINPLTIGYFTFSPDTRISLDYNQRNREWSLIIQSVRPEDEGWYHCQVTTKDSDLYYPVKLNVLTVQITGTDYVVVGSRLELMCNATGKPDPPHDVEWLKDGVPLQSNSQDGILITKKIETKVLVSLLVITEVQLSDKAVYKCRSSNNDEAEFTLNVLDPAIQHDSMDKRDRSDDRNGQVGLYTGTSGRGTASSWIHRKSPLILPFVCVSAGLLFQDTRWRL